MIFHSSSVSGPRFDQDMFWHAYFADVVNDPRSTQSHTHFVGQLETLCHGDAIFR